MKQRVKLTERVVERLAAPDPSGKQVLHWDAELKGFGVLCSGVTTSKAYVVQRTLPGNITRRVTVASVAEVSLATARDTAATMLFDLRQGRDPKARTATLQSTLDDYLRKRDGKLSAASVQNYRTMIEKHLADWLDKPLATITRKRVEAKHADIAKTIAEQGRGKGETSANAAMRTLRLLWNFAKKSDVTLGENPVDLRGDWFEEKRRERIVDAAAMPAFYQGVMALPNPIARDYILFVMFTGLRRREAAMLKWEHVDFANRLIRIPAANTKARRKLDLPMVDVVRDMLIARQSVGRETSGYVFPSHGKLTGYIAEPKFPLDAVGKACGTYVSVHDLRRTFITTAEETEISVMALKALVNHSLGRDVTEGYVQMTAERLRVPAQRVADRLKLLCGIGQSLPANVVPIAAE